MAIFQNQGPDLLKVFSLQTATYDKADLVSGRNEGLRLLPAENNTHSPFSAFGLMNVRGQNRHKIWVVGKQINYQARRTVISKNAESAHTSAYMYVYVRFLYLLSIAQAILVDHPQRAGKQHAQSVRVHTHFSAAFFCGFWQIRP